MMTSVPGLPRLRLVIAGAAVLALVLTACGSDSAGSQQVSGVTANDGVIAPPGGPYSYSVPAGWHALTTIEVGDPSSAARARSAVARGTGLISVVSSNRRSGDPHHLAAAYVAGLTQEKISSRLVSISRIDGSPAITLDVANVPVPGGGTAKARRTLLFAPGALILISCQWVEQNTRSEVLDACTQVTSSLKLTTA
jgi:hypothetical protein